MGERYWRAIASLLIASVILRRNDSGRTPGGADETDPPSYRLNRAIRTIRSLVTLVPAPSPPTRWSYRPSLCAWLWSSP